MDLNEYQKLAARTIPQDKPKDKRVAEFCVGTLEEAGESVGVLKKVVFHDHPFNEEKREKLVSELGDLMWHVAALATEYGLTLDEIGDYNVNYKLKKRYPKGYDNERSIHRD
jgi:NTP pyrophosphatase (non-canonical NTP hydrolase)